MSARTAGAHLIQEKNVIARKRKRRQMLMMPSVSFTEIPDNTKRVLNASLAEAVRTAFQDPKVCRDYEKWRKERARRKELIHE